MSELSIYICAALLVAVSCHIMIMMNRKPEEEKKNYKNIAQMAKNLTHCKPSTRKTVLNELNADPNWSDEEVQELVSVLEGILNTRLHLGESKGLIIRKER